MLPSIRYVQKAYVASAPFSATDLLVERIKPGIRWLPSHNVYDQNMKKNISKMKNGFHKLPPNVPAPEPAHVLRERMQAADEGRPMRHPYRGMPLTGAPAARFPKYLWTKRFNDYEDLDNNGHAPETLDIAESERDGGCDTGWVDHADCYILDGDRQVKGIRKVNGSMATEEELQNEAGRYSASWAADSRFCHVFNHSHECKPTCFKNTEYKKPSVDEPPKQRAACRFRFWRLVLILGQWFRRMGKALVSPPS